MTQSTRSSTETKQLAATFIQELLRSPQSTGARVIALYGELGAGKTTFVQGIAEALGVSEPAKSPTFVIERIYRVPGYDISHLIHIDAYRLAGPEELQHLGWDDIVKDEKNLIIIEWAEKVEALLPPQVTRVHCSLVSANLHEIRY